MKKFLAALLCLAFIRLNAQNTSESERFVPYWKAGLNIGASNLLSDLGGTAGIGKKGLRDFNARGIGFLSGGSLGYRPKKYLNIRLDLNYTQLKASDSYIKNPVIYSGEWFRHYRNLSVKTHVIESVLGIDYIPFHFNTGTSVFEPYLGVGIGGFYFNPTASLHGKWYSLQPLHTEGQGSTEAPYLKPYRRFNVNFPIRAGFQFSIKKRWTLSFEACRKFTFTDYLDDVSGHYVSPDWFRANLSPEQAEIAIQLSNRSPEIDPEGKYSYVSAPGEMRGNSKNNDAYFSGYITLGYLFGKPFRERKVKRFSESLDIAQRNEAYNYTINLKKISNDELVVRLDVPIDINEADAAVFKFPKIVPGTYKDYNYGRFVKALYAFDTHDQPLKTNRSDVNTWEISNPKVLSYIIYYLEDTYDTRQAKIVFEAAGSDFEAKHHFILNGEAIFGYFKNYTQLPFEIAIERDSSFFGASTIKKQSRLLNHDLFYLNDYSQVVDNPIMYSKPDTANYKLKNGMDVMIAVCDKTNKTLTAKEALNELIPLLEAQYIFFEKKKLSDRYIFLIYINDKTYLSKSFGALEHNQCAMICLPPDTKESSLKNLRDIAAHEFFHILTPLNIRSESIAKFNYSEPEMSEHLWLYEGVTEYLSHQAQVQGGLVSPTQFLNTMSEKIRYSKFFKDVALTKMSKFVLDDEFKRLYGNIYQKGAIAAMGLDLTLMKCSNGDYSLKKLMLDLSKIYGPNKSFKDYELFTVIDTLAGRCPDVSRYLRKCIADTLSIPLKELCTLAGVNYSASGYKTDLSPMGGLDNGGLEINDDGYYTVVFTDSLDEFGRDFIKFESGDVIKKWNDKDAHSKNFLNILLRYSGSVKEGDPLQVLVERNGKSVLLKTTITPVQVKSEHVFELVTNPSEIQLKLRERWLQR